MMKHIPTTTQNGIIRCVLILNGKSSFKIRKKPEDSNLLKFTHKLFKVKFTSRIAVVKINYATRCLANEK